MSLCLALWLQAHPVAVFWHYGYRPILFLHVFDGMGT